jgi:xylulokinase
VTPDPVTPDPEAVLALDLGTGRLKAGLVGLDGTIRAWAIGPYETVTDGEWTEQDPTDWWDALVGEMRRLRVADPRARVVAIAVVGQGPTCVPVDRAGVPTRRAILWLDRRAGSETAELAERLGVRPWLLGITPAALWVERYEPAVAARTAHYLAAWEWLTQLLTGVAARTASAGQLVPDPVVVEQLGLSASKLPPVVPAGTIVGPLMPEAAEALGLVAGIPVVAGLNDAYASFLGAGLRDPGDAIDTGGRSGGFAVYVDHEPTVPGAWIAPAPLTGRWLVGGAMAATGQSLDWLRHEVLGGEASIESLLDEAGRVPPGADGLVFLPYLAGERSPIWDPEARGAFVGLTLGHGRGHLVRAVLEAAAFAIRHVVDPIRSGGLPITEIRVCGGQARSAVWNRIKADALGAPVAVPEVPDAAMLGAAVLAVAGVGAAASIEAAMASMVRVVDRVEPDPAVASTYDATFAVYRSLYPALREAMHRLGDLDPTD